MMSVKQAGIKYHLVRLDLELNPGLPDHWQTLYPLSQSVGNFIFEQIVNARLFAYGLIVSSIAM